MNKTLKDFLAERKAEIKIQIAALRRELQQINAAQGIVDDDDVDDGGGAVRERTRSGQQTIKDMAMIVTDGKKEGADAGEIIRMIKERFDKDIPRESLSPQLSRLKAEGKMDLIGKIWKRTDVDEEPIA